MRKISKEEIMNEMIKNSDKRRKQNPTNGFVKAFYVICYFIIVGWIVGGIVDLFKSE